MALGVVACADSRGLYPCIGEFEDQPLSKDFPRLYSSRIDARFGETTQLEMTVENSQEHAQTLVATLHPLVLFFVVSPDCRVYWFSPLSQVVTKNNLDFRPHEEKEFAHEWSLTDHWGEMVPPGDYHLYGFMSVIEEPINDGEDSRRRHDGRHLDLEGGGGAHQRLAPRVSADARGPILVRRTGGRIARSSRNDQTLKIVGRMGELVDAGNQRGPP